MGSAKIDEDGTKFFLCGQFLVKVFQNGAGSLPAFRQNRWHVVRCPDGDIFADIRRSQEQNAVCYYCLRGPQRLRPRALFTVKMKKLPRHTELTDNKSQKKKYTPYIPLSVGGSIELG